ncbi:hypothetical protein M0R45_035824 [Rubus argutus]|uniref:Uncharacterized protein n=1 Tax=Rubus argutus TaxID=59490 RepID=A0AAW1VY46_RUBAR
MVLIVLYDALGDSGLVELSSILVRVNILGLPLALLTLVAALFVGKTLGSVVNLDKVRLQLGDLVLVLIPTLFEGSNEVSIPSHGIFGSCSFATFQVRSLCGF